MNIKSVVFDAYGTLFDVNSAAEKCKEKIGDSVTVEEIFWYGCAHCYSLELPIKKCPPVSIDSKQILATAPSCKSFCF